MITREADYATRTIIFLAKRYKKGPVSTTLIGQEMKIPYRFLRKISHQLVASGFADAKRGKHGGIFLIIDPKKISMLDILNVFDQRSLSLNVCCLPEPDCDCERKSACKISPHFQKIQHRMHETFRKLTIDRLLKG